MGDFRRAANGKSSFQIESGDKEERAAGNVLERDWVLRYRRWRDSIRLRLRALAGKSVGSMKQSPTVAGLSLTPRCHQPHSLHALLANRPLLTVTRPDADYPGRVICGTVGQENLDGLAFQGRFGRLVPATARRVLLDVGRGKCGAHARLLNSPATRANPKPTRRERQKNPADSWFSTLAYPSPTNQRRKSIVKPCTNLPTVFPLRST